MNLMTLKEAEDKLSERDRNYIKNMDKGHFTPFFMDHMLVDYIKAKHPDFGNLQVFIIVRLCLLIWHGRILGYDIKTQEEFSRSRYTGKIHTNTLDFLPEKRWDKMLINIDDIIAYAANGRKEHRAELMHEISLLRHSVDRYSDYGEDFNEFDGLCSITNKIIENE